MKYSVSLFLAFIIASLISTTFGADKKKSGEVAMMSPMKAEIASKDGADFEAAYLGMMILHHKNGLPMWALVPEKGTNPELKAMEKKTTPKEQAEIEEMTGWLKQWHNKSPQDFKEPAASMQKKEKDMSELKGTIGKQFDVMFAKMMAHHHMGAIEMAKLALEKAEHAEVKAAAKMIIKSQTEDRQTLLTISEHKK